MIKVAHIYASEAKTNSGDYMIGIATKKYFQDKYLDNKECIYTDFDCRMTYDEKLINLLNKNDYILVGGGGLILPDSNPNKISCWQWSIPKELYKKITKPIYVLSIGYNLFYNQTMGMYDRNSNIEDKTRIDIFRENIIKLIEISKYFSMRHKWDIDQLINIIGEEYRDKIKFELCPTIWYSENFWKNNLPYNTDNYIAIEIKDDREWRRYHKISKNKFYSELLEFVNYCLKENKKVCILSHDGSSNFYNFLKLNKINLPFLNNSISNEKKIYENYGKIKQLICTAGHSQMIANGLGITIIPLVSHPKVKNFCDDIGFDKYIDINLESNICDKLKSYLEE
jgi:polysaccharide pyruvyl transferase WcaK-like protein